MCSINYAEEMYKSYLRDLIKDVAKKYPNNSEETLKLEMKYILERLKEKQIDFLFESILNKDMYFQCMDHQIIGSNEYRKGLERLREVDFSTVPQNYKRDKDIVWILQKGTIKYPKEDLMQPNREEKGRNRQFRQLLEQLEFSDKEKQIFYYSDKEFYFNALGDNGDIIYRQLKQDIISYKGVMASMDNRDTYIFLNAVEKNNLSLMRGKLRDLLDLCYKPKTSKCIQKMCIQDIIKVAEYLSDLVPVIYQNSKLKSIEQLQEEQIAVRLIVFKKLLVDDKCGKGKSRYDSLEKIIVEHFHDHVLIKTFLNMMFDRKETNEEKFNDDQILVISEGYFNSLGQNLRIFISKVEKYREVCNKLCGKSCPIQMYRDIWEEVWKDNS